MFLCKKYCKILEVKITKIQFNNLKHKKSLKCVCFNFNHYSISSNVALIPIICKKLQKANFRKRKAELINEHEHDFFCGM